MADRPLSVSVIMTCYNEGLYIREAVRSVLDQTRSDLIERIVIADDGSNEETVAVLKNIETWDSRIVVSYGRGGNGLPAQRNAAIAMTASPLIAILDGDDLWVQEKLALQIAVISKDERIGLVYSDYFQFADGNQAGARRAGVLDISAAKDLVVTYFLNDPPIIPSTTLIRRSAFDRCGGFDASVRVFEDTDFYIRLARVCRFALVDRPLLYKRTRTSSITGGRKDLIAHHAYVALKAAAQEPRLLKMVPLRLAERARKLANQKFLLGDRDDATRLALFSLRMRPWHIGSWLSLALAIAPDPVVSVLKRRFLAARLNATVVETSRSAP